MEDFITKQEFEDRLDQLRQELLVVGDDQTISVQQGAGGQLVSSMMAVSAPADDPDVYTKVSYNSDSEFFEIEVTNQPFFHTGASDTYERDTSYEIQKASTQLNNLRFVKPAAESEQIGLHVEFSRVRGLGDVYRITWSGSASAYDDQTATYEQSRSNVGGINQFQQVIIKNDGTYTISDDQMAPVAMSPGTNVSKPVLWWDEPAGGTITLQDFYDPINTLTVPNTLTKTGVGTGTSDQVILAMDYDTGSLVLDLYANRATYDRHYVIGRIKVETLGGAIVATQCFLFMQQVPQFGFSGTVSMIEGIRDNGGTIQKKIITMRYANGQYLEGVIGDWINI
jgi:hypothetical protein